MGLAARAAGHAIIAVVGRDPARTADAATRLGATPLSLDEGIPAADLLMLSVSDDAIEVVAREVAPRAGAIGSAIHLSGLTPVSALSPLPCPVGSVHPLQTLPAPEVGAARLAGSWAAVTADEPLASRLESFVRSIGARPFRLPDERKALYHAAAAAAANFTIGSLGMASDLLAAAELPFEVSKPLVEAIVDNAYALGPWAALTGPIARGDVGTVAAQLRAVEAVSKTHAEAFAEMASALARMVDSTEIKELLA